MHYNENKQRRKSSLIVYAPKCLNKFDIKLRGMHALHESHTMP